jgi:hypothetical protein
MYIYLKEEQLVLVVLLFLFNACAWVLCWYLCDHAYTMLNKERSMSKIVLVALIAVQSLVSGCTVVVWSSPEAEMEPSWLSWPEGEIQEGGWVHSSAGVRSTSQRLLRNICAKNARVALAVHSSAGSVSIEAHYQMSSTHHCLAKIVTE